MFLARLVPMLLAVPLLAALFFAAPCAQANPEMANPAATCPERTSPGAADSPLAGRFAAMSPDQDGKVSREKFLAAYPHMRDAAFDAIDADRDGFITLDEWLAFFRGQHVGGGSHEHSHGPDGDCPVCPPSGAVEDGPRRIPDLIMPLARP